MKTVEVVIKIPQKVYEDCIMIPSDIKGWKDEISKAFKNGTVLPERHGRLIDADAFERRCMFDSDIEDMQDVIYALRDYKTIIEADKEVDL